MYGALLGDMIGAPYEFDRGTNRIVHIGFPLLDKRIIVIYNAIKLK